MRPSLSDISLLLGGTALILSIGLAGCGDFCITGFSVNGTGQVNVNAGNPPPPCTLPHVNAMVRTVALKTRACAGCSNDARATHVFVTLQGIQLHPPGTEQGAFSTWIEIAPQFTGKPRQIDLIGDSLSEVLEENVLVPAGNYREVRLLFAGSSEGSERVISENVCGGGQRNCLVMASGRGEGLVFPSGASELLLPIDTKGGNGSFALLPDTKMELQLRLEPLRVFHSSVNGGWEPQMTLTGYAAMESQRSSDAGKNPSD